MGVLQIQILSHGATPRTTRTQRKQKELEAQKQHEARLAASARAQERAQEKADKERAASKAGAKQSTKLLRTINRLTMKLGEDAGIVKAKKLAMRSAKWREDRLEDRGTRDACGLKRQTARSSKKLVICQ